MVSEAHQSPGFLTLVQTQLSFQSHRLTFSHASEVRGENTTERKFASTGYQTRNHQVMSQTRLPLSQTAHGSALFADTFKPIFTEHGPYMF